MELQTILVILSLILLAGVIYYNYKYRQVKEGSKSPEEILKERYVRGKMSKYEYDVKKQDVEKVT